MADVQVSQGRLGKLASSAFTTLGVSVRANKEQILEAYDDKLFEGVAEERLAVARAKLTLARDRLSEELRFLSDVAPTRAREAVTELSSVSDAGSAIAIAESLPNLSRINAFAELLSRFGSLVVESACEAYGDFDPDSAREAIDQTRAASGFPPVSDAAWSRELSAFQEEQARLFFEAVRASKEPAVALAQIVERSSTTTTDWYAAFLSKAVDLYDRWSEPKLVEIEEQLDRSIARVREVATDTRAVQAIERHLADWDLVNQPVQLRDHSKGLDEPKSKRVFNKVRSLAIWLANDCGEYSSAYALSLALEHTFPELPSVVAQLSEDIETLSSLVERARSQELVQPLADVVQRARDQINVVAAQVMKGNFSGNGSGIAGELYRHHLAASALAHRLSPPDLPWYLTRSVALELNNEAAQPHAAGIILEFILNEAPESIASRIEDDLKTLHGLKLQQEFHEAIKAQDLRKARDLATRIVDEVPDERDAFIRLRDALDQRIAQRTRSRWFWGILAGIVAIVLINDATQERGSSGYEPNYDTSNYEAPTGSPSASATADEDAASSGEESSAETAPPPGHFGPLSLGQLRYCKFEERRIDLLEPRVPPSAYAAFNDRVRDFNSRCANGRYRSSDAALVDAELASSAGRLEQEVDATLQEWTPVVPTFPETSGSTSGSEDTSDAPSQEETPWSDDPLAPVSDPGDTGE